MRRISRTERRDDVAAACCLTACFSSALSFSPTELGAVVGGEGVLSVAWRRYRAADIVEVCGGVCEFVSIRGYFV
jgi:hypothetical protein